MLKDRRSVPLASYTTFGIGGPADYFIEPTSSEELVEAVKFAQEKNLPFFVLGTGANILIGDKGFRGVVIKNEAKSIVFSDYSNQTTAVDSSQHPDSKFVIAESGATVEELIKFTLEKGLSGFEHFAGIPSSVGGALWQNLHFLSPDRSKTVFVGDIVHDAEIFSHSQQWVSQSSGTQSDQRKTEQQDFENKQQKSDSRIRKVDHDYFNFSYDYSCLHDTHDIVLSATFTLTPEDPKIIQERIEANLKWRKEKHPINAVKTSAGSIFKKIEGYGAGRLIEQVGLKGKSIGGAKISEEHANFIVNENNATAKDVRELISLVQTTVKKELGLHMQIEISFVGEF